MMLVVESAVYSGGGAGKLSSGTGLEGILGGKDIGETKVTIGLVGMS